MLRKRIISSLVFLLIVLCCASVARGVYKTAWHSRDFRWHTERLFLHRIDPWHVYLEGDPHHDLVAGQIPNDVPLTYILLLPFGLLPYEAAKLVWACCNVLMCFVSGGLIVAYMRLSSRRAALLLCAFFMSTCFRWGMDAGQQCFLAMFLITLTYCSRFGTPERPGAIPLGLSYFKYSFAPPFFFDLLFRGLWKRAVISLMPMTAALVVVRLWLGSGSGVLHLLTAPLIAGNRSYPADVFTFDVMLYLQLAAARLDLSVFGERALVDGVPLLLCAALVWIICRDPRIRPDGRTGLLMILSILLFRHMPYDYVVLLFPTTYAVKYIRSTGSKIFLGCVCWFAFCTQVILRFSKGGQLGFWWVVVGSFVLLGAFLAFWHAAAHEQTVQDEDMSLDQPQKIQSVGLTSPLRA